jgi:hypothetical protein
VGFAHLAAPSDRRGDDFVRPPEGLVKTTWRNWYRPISVSRGQNGSEFPPRTGKVRPTPGLRAAVRSPPPGITLRFMPGCVRAFAVAVLVVLAPRRPPRARRVMSDAASAPGGWSWLRQVKVNGASGGHRLQTDRGCVVGLRFGVVVGVVFGWCPVLAVHSSSGPGTWRGRKRRRLCVVLGLFFAACTPARTLVRGTCPARTGHQPRPEECALR